MPIASPIGSGSAINPIQDAGTSDRPSRSSGIWNRARPRTALVSAPSVGPRVRGSRDRARPRGRNDRDTASASHTTMHGTTMASWIRGHVADPLERRRRARDRVTVRASPYAPSATRYGSQTIHGRRSTTAIGAGNTSPRWTAAGHISMYRTPVNSARGAGTGRPGRRRSSSSRGTTARCCPPPRTRRARARSRPGRPGRRANTKRRHGRDRDREHDDAPALEHRPGRGRAPPSRPTSRRTPRRQRSSR